VAPKPGEAFSECGTGLPDPRPETNLSTLRAQFRAKRGSLERLRFGDRYSFRLRTVDLAGNGLTVEEANRVVQASDDLRFFNSGCYERVEPLAPPILVPLHPPAEGEGNDQLVIRSDERRATEREWLLLPPGASPPFVELHGALDGLDACTSWGVLRDHDAGTPEWNLASRGRGDGWIKDGWTCLHGGFRLPYLPDPMIDRVLFRQRASSGTISTVASMEIAHDRKNLHYPERIAGHRVRLEAARSPRIEGGRTLEIGLPPGRIARIQVASIPAADDFKDFGLLGWCTCDPKDKDLPCDEIEASGAAPKVTREVLEQQACSGNLGLITPARELTVVHAVARPLIPGGRKSLAFVTDQAFRFGNPVQIVLGECELSQGKTASCSFDLHGSVWIDRPSTGKLDIRLRWNEPIDNPQFPDVVQAAHGLDPFQVAVPLDSQDYVQFSETVAGCADGSPRTKTDLCVPRDTFPIAGKVRFEDGRHREVQLSFDATTRFADYYPTPKPEPGAPEGQDLGGRFRRSSEPVTVHFPARVEPAAPNPVYMVPTFRHSQERRGKELHAERRGGLRIFVARDWFSSGSSEQLAVVFAPTRTAVVQPPLDQVLSMWGADPLWEPIESDHPPYDQLKTGLPRMPPRPVLDDVRNVETPVPNLFTPLRVVPADASKPVELAEVELSLAAYTPQLDHQKNLWFIDVDIEAPTYFSFLRLGLARYQPYAEEGRNLSVLVPAVISQLVPDCAVSVVPGRKKRCFEVTVLMTSSAAVPLYPPRIDRTFEALVFRHRASTSRLPSALDDAMPAANLDLVSNGDGEAKWRGTIDADDAGLCPRFLVLEKQTWASGGCRVVGCVEVIK
jgi:hypothetical protein